ncbi:MAG TPA: hypothetical protein P5116_03040 [Eubacteriales bacterium]|nr:hypothetical protein [Clostridia bacterium]HRV72839.1 hypothetical protein [Eubacteriales bacterium]
MPTEVTNYQCPACTGPLHFDAATGRLVCDYCGSSYSASEVEALYKNKDEKAAAESAGSEWHKDEAENLRAYVCPSCGAEIICDAVTAATSCAYCGNPTIVPAALSGSLRPDYAIPFKVERDAAAAALYKYVKKPFVPKAFKEFRVINEIKGIYLPFWLYDGAAEASIVCNAERVSVHRRGNKEYTTTMHFEVDRSGSFSFERLPADGSTKTPDRYMDAIEPFDYSQLVPFSTAYLPGKAAEKYDVSAEDCRSRAEERVNSAAESLLRETITGYSVVTTQSLDVSVSDLKVSYALLPVWQLRVRHKDKDYLFMVNGQTGKAVGDLPISKGLMLVWFAGLAVGITLIMLLIILISGGVL